MKQVNVDQFSAGFISGWAQDEGAGGLALELLVNGQSVGQRTADRYRADLAEAGIAGGFVGFSFILESALKDGDAVVLRAIGATEVLFEQTFDGGVSDGLTAAFAFARGIKLLAAPHWNSMVHQGPEGLLVTGALILPESIDVENIELIDLHSGEKLPFRCTPAASLLRDYYWFFDGNVFELSHDTAVASKRKRLAVVDRRHPDKINPLNIAEIPSQSDLDAFVFAGADRARRVAGSADTLQLFASGGLTQAMQLCEIADSLDLNRDAAVLDWGCGASRVLQFVAKERPDWKLSGADIDQVNIDWSEQELSSIASFTRLPLLPPSGYADQTFDLIYGLSVITHLEKATRDAWLKELARIIKPGGHLIVTYMGVWQALHCGRQDAAIDIYAQLADTGISDSSPDFALGEELSSYYKATFNTREELLAVVEPDFEVVGEYPRSLCYQDALVLKRRSTVAAG